MTENVFKPDRIGVMGADATLAGATSSRKMRMALVGKDYRDLLVAVRVVEEGSIGHRLHQLSEAFFGRHFTEVKVEGLRDGRVLYVNINSCLKRAQKDIRGLTAEEAAFHLNSHRGAYLGRERGEVDRAIGSKVPFPAQLTPIAWGAQGLLTHRGVVLGRGATKTVFPAVRRLPGGRLVPRAVYQVNALGKEVFRTGNDHAWQMQRIGTVVAPAEVFEENDEYLYAVTTRYDFDGMKFDDNVQGNPFRPMLDVAKAIQALHGQRPARTHKDIKPANLFFRNIDGQTRGVLGDLDFVGAEKKASRTGTLDFMATDRSHGLVEGDIYSFGKTLGLMFKSDDQQIQELATWMCNADARLRPTIDTVIVQLQDIARQWDREHSGSGRDGEQRC